MTAYRAPAGATGPPGPQGVPGPVPATTGGRKYSQYTGAGQEGYETPDANSLDITDNISLRCLVRLNSLTPVGVETFESKWTSTEASYSFGFDNQSRLRFDFSVSGTAASSTITIESDKSTGNLLSDLLGNNPLVPVWLRVDALANVGGSSQATFSYSYNYATWTQIGPAVLNATPGPWHSGTAALDTGSRARTTLPFTGRIYVAEVWNMAGPTMVAQADFRVAASPPAAFTGGAGETWTPLGSAAIDQDEVNWQDFLDGTLTVIKLTGGRNSYILTTDPTTGEVVWAPSPANYYNVLNYGATGAYADDNSGGIQAAHDAADSDVGGVVYLPGPPLTEGQYRCATGISATKPNITFRGDPSSLGFTGVQFPGGTRQLLTLGGSQVISDSGVVGITAGDGTSRPVSLNGTRIENLTFQPLWLRVGSSYSGGNTLVVKSNDAANLATWASNHPTGTIWVQYTNGILAKLIYGGVDLPNKQFTGVAVSWEAINGSTYGADSLITLAGAQGGIRVQGTSNYQIENCVTNGFNDQDAAAYGIYLDGASGIQVNPQYGCISHTNSWNCYRNLVGNSTQGRVQHCTFDTANNSTIPVPNTINIDITDPAHGWILDDVAVQAGATHVRVLVGAANRRNGIHAFGMRHEAWAASGFAYDIGVNGSIIITRLGTSHNSAPVFQFRSGATSNTAIFLPAFAAGEGTWVDSGTHNRVINLASGQMYGFGPQQYSTAGRTGLAAGFGAGIAIFDTTLGLPLWSDGANWRDASGVVR